MRSVEDFSVGTGTEVPFASAGASRYAAEMGQRRARRFDNVVVNRPQAEGIAKDYMAAPSFDRLAIPSYRALADETKRQFDFMTRPTNQGGLGISVDVTKTDPYTKLSKDGQRELPDPKGMRDDVLNNRHISVLSTQTTGGHPLLTNDENDMFRAVHDVFGHAATGRAFDAHGEEAAYRSHASMFSPLARVAMTTETRGQNSANNYGGLPRGEFVEQKITALPRSAQLITPINNREHFETAVAEAKKAHERAFGPVGR
jgi:hypothetical protein